MRNPLSSQSSNFSPNTSGNNLMPKTISQSISPTKENNTNNGFGSQAIYPDLCTSMASDNKEKSQNKAEESGSDNNEQNNEQNNDETIIYESASEPSQLYLRISSMADEKEFNGKGESGNIKTFIIYYMTYFELRWRYYECCTIKPKKIQAQNY
jgi:hypothetical protein